MKKIILIICILFLLTGCSGSLDSFDYNPDIDYVSNDRLIIYTVNFSLDVSDLEESLNFIDNVNVDKWYKEKTIYENYAYLNLRVETSKLDEFTNSIKSIGSVSNYSIKSTDITNSYYDLESDKNRLEVEHERLLELMNTSSPDEIILIINPRLFEIEQEIEKINKQLPNYDTSMLYSYVSIRVYHNRTDSSFFATIGESFSNGFSFVGNLVTMGISLFVFFLPLTLVGGSVIAVIVIPVVIVQKKRRKLK